MSVEWRQMERRPSPLRTSPGGPSSPSVDCIGPLPISIPPGRASPKPSWEETMNDLSRGLQLICGSPPSASSFAGSTSPGRFPSSASPTVFAFGDRTTPPLRGLHRANSVQAQGSRLVQRPVFVRHIETQAELSNRLVEICQTQTTLLTRRTGSPVPATAHAQTSRTPPFPVLVRPFDRKAVLCSNFSSSARVRVRVAPHRAEDLIVSVRDDDGGRLLVSVEAVSGSSRRLRVLLHQAPLPAGTQPRRLVADLGGDGVLSVRERASTRAEVTFNNVSAGSVFLPVVRRDESSLELTIVLHVPRHFRFEDVSVQTVDDRVVVMGKRRSFSPPGGAAAAFSFRSATSVLPTFRVSLQLPSGTDSRSVSALLTEHRQLVIRGTLGPLSRRSTL